MKNKTGEAKKKKSRALPAVLLIILLTAAIIGTAYAVSRSDDNLLNADGSSATTEATLQTTEKTSETDTETEAAKPTQTTYKTETKSGFPLSFSGEISMIAVSDLYVYSLVSGTVYINSFRGGAVADYILNYTDPMIKAAGRYLLAYDRQGSSFSLFEGKKLITKGETPDSGYIISGTVCENGRFTLSYRHSSAASAISYYKKNGEIISTATCREEHIISSDISDNRKYIAFAAINSIKGELYTHVYLVNTATSENVADYKFSGTAALDCMFTSGKNIAVVCNNQRIYINVSRAEVTPKIAEYPSTVVMRASDKNANTAVITKNAQSASEYTLTLYKYNNDILYQTDISSDINSISCFHKKVYAVTSNKLMLFNSSGSAKETELDASQLCGVNACSRAVFCRSLTAIYRE